MHRTTRANVEMGVNENEMAFGGICIANGTDDPDDAEILAEVVVDDPSENYESEIAVTLFRGGYPKQSGQVIDVYGKGNQRVMVTDDPVMGVGYYLHLLEIHGVVHEDKLYAEFAENLPDLYAQYEEYREGLSRSDRRLRLLDQVDTDLEYDDFYQPVMDSSDARWRSTNLSNRNERRAAKAISGIDANPKFCYKNSRQILEQYFWDDEDVSYVEGIALSKHAARITGHAWIEFDNEVAEVTWPWHSPNPDGTGAVYYGVEIPRSTIREQTEGLAPDEDAGPLFLNIDDPSRLG